MQKLIFKLRASQAGKIMGGTIGLTDVQETRLKELKSRDEDYKNSRGTAEEFLKVKESIPDLKTKVKESKKEFKEDSDEYRAAFNTLSDAESKLADLTAKLKGIAPLTDNMKSEYEGLLHKKLNPVLPQGAKTFLKNWVKEQLFKRREEIRSKFIDKGNQTEEDGFTLMCVQLDLGMVYKNETHKENDFFTGCCDLDLEEEIIDNKSSYSVFTFPMFEDHFNNDDYYYQLIVYMDLYGKEKSRLVYTLNDTPIDLIRREVSWMFNEDAKQKAALNLVFTKDHWDKVKSELFPNAEPIEFVEIPARLRVKHFSVDLDPKVVQDLKQRVILSQKYVDELIQKYEIH